MSLKRPEGLGKETAGTLVVLEHSSKILKGNPPGDPHVRKVGVWLPPQYDSSPTQRFPVLHDLVGCTGSGLAHANLGRFTLDRVVSIINRLGSRVDAKPRVRPAGRAHHAACIEDRRAAGW